jgi:hypothetical protein
MQGFAVCADKRLCSRLITCARQLQMTYINDMGEWSQEWTYFILRL